MNRERLERLSKDGSILDKYSKDRLPQGAAKLGEGMDNVVLGADYIETNSSHPRDPGLRLGAEGSSIRHGAKLDMEGDYQKLFFKRGEQQLNQLGDKKASSTTDPLPTVMPTLRNELGPFVDPDFRAALDGIRALSSQS